MVDNRNKARSGIRDSKMLNREALKKGLITYAEDFVKKRNELPLINEDEKMERVVHQDWDGPMPILIQLIYFKGVTPK